MIIDIAYLDMALAKSSEFLDFFRIALPSVSVPNVSLREQCIVLRMKRHSWGTSSSTWKQKYLMFSFFCIITFPGSPSYCFENSLGFVKCQNHPATSCWELINVFRLYPNSMCQIKNIFLSYSISGEKKPWKPTPLRESFGQDKVMLGVWSMGPFTPTGLVLSWATISRLPCDLHGINELF